MARKKVIETEVVLVDSNGYYVDMDVEGRYCFTITRTAGKMQTTCVLEAAILCINNKRLPDELYKLPVIYNHINMESVLILLSGYSSTPGEEWIVDWNDIIDVYKNKFGEKIRKMYYTCNTFGELVSHLKEYFNMSVMLNFAMENNYIKI